jgi:hypothetical protein
LQSWGTLRTRQWRKALKSKGSLAKPALVGRKAGEMTDGSGLDRTLRDATANVGFGWCSSSMSEVCWFCDASGGRVWIRLQRACRWGSGTRRRWFRPAVVRCSRERRELRELGRVFGCARWNVIIHVCRLGGARGLKRQEGSGRSDAVRLLTSGILRGVCCAAGSSSSTREVGV